MRLADKTALITGAASGMGRLAAQMFAREGAQVIATDVAEAPLQKTVEMVKAAGGAIVGIRGDADYVGFRIARLHNRGRPRPRHKSSFVASGLVRRRRM